jgi:hypothetical protein
METQHIGIQYHNIEVIVKLIHIECHVLGFIQDEAKSATKDRTEFLRKRLSLTVSPFSSP